VDQAHAVVVDQLDNGVYTMSSNWSITGSSPMMRIPRHRASRARRAAHSATGSRNVMRTGDSQPSRLAYRRDR